VIKSDCLCQKNSLFQPKIVYENETVFRNFNSVTIGRCINCGLLKTVLQPKNKFNPQTTHADFYEEKHFLFVSLLQPIVDQIKKYKKTGLVLDVGCSSGILLELLKKEGFDIYGIEPNKKAFLISQKKFGGKIFNGYLSEYIKKKPRGFDVIIYNHVLEHIDKVVEEINLIKKVLKPGGLLVIGVPNINNIIFFLRQKYWEYLVALEHIWHFSKKYLVNFLNKKGFNVSEVSFSNDRRPDYPILKRGYFYFLSIINKLFNTGELMLIVAQLKYDKHD